MKGPINGLLPVIFTGLFAFSGCAKQGVVKNDASLVPVAAKDSTAAPINATAPSAKAASKSAASAVTNEPTSVSKGLNKPQQSSSTPVAADLQNKLEKIFFDFDAATLSATARQTLSKNYEAIKQSPQSRIRIEGNCDERGSDEYNLALGERRAQAAARYLTTLGLSSERVSTISYGKEKPAYAGHDETAWSKNRRDEFVITSR